MCFSKWVEAIKQAVLYGLSAAVIVFSASAAVVSANQSTAVFETSGNQCPRVEIGYSTFNEYHYSSTGVDASGSATGLKILSLRRTAADMMLDLRFKILDIEQTKSIMDRKTPVYLIDQVSGYRYRVPVTTKLGPLRQTTKQVDINKTYFIMFANPGRSIKKCDIVTVMIGDTSIDNIIVE